MSSANISTILSLSTAHLSPATRKQLDEWCANIDLRRQDHSFSLGSPPTLMAASDHGWFVFVTEDTDGLPDDLAMCLDYARNEDCAYVLFDGDASADTSLPVHEDVEFAAGGVA